MQAPLGIAVIDSLTGRIRAVNPAFARISGRGEDELTRLDWTSLIHPDDAKADPDQTAPLNAGRSAGFRMEKRCLRPDGTSVWIRMTISPVESEDAARPRRLCMIEDISARKRSEIESLGVLAGGIAHDFNNSLAAVLGNLSLLRSRVEGDGESLELVKEAQAACEIAKGVANQLLTFAKGGTPVAAVMDLRPLLRQEAVLAARGTGARCVFDLGAAPLPVSIDKDQISRVIRNLVLNAAQAMPRGGNVILRAEVVALDASDRPHRTAGRCVRVSIEDQGPGIEPAHLSKIFDPYFSTKGVGRGLGLATCYSIMTKHGGAVSAEPGAGGGAVFTLCFPAANAAALPREAEPPAPETRRRRVLIMDDEPQVARVLSRMLEHMGHQTETVRHGEAALETYRGALETGEPYDAVILDLTVRGGLGAPETLSKLAELDPGVKALVSSGYADDAVISDFGSFGFRAALAKPYRLDDVAEALRRTIGPD